LRQGTGMAELAEPGATDTPTVVLRKVQTRLVPFLALLYAFCIIDRMNVSYASLQMKGDLHFSNIIYGFGSGVFFIGYFIFEVPSNLIMERVGARRWIGRIMLTWGVISAAMMTVSSPLSFYTLRFLLGVAEAGFYPGMILYLTYWVPSHYRARVIARFLSLQAVFALSSPLIGGALLRMSGVGGLRGWQWLFLIEGIPSIILGFAVLKWLPDGPEQALWLNADEKRWITSILQRDVASQRQIHHLSFKTAFHDVRIVQVCAIFLIAAIGGNSVGFFGPQLLKARSHGLWSDSMVTAVNIVPAMVGAFAMVCAAGHSDRSGHRKLHIFWGYLIAGSAFLACAHAPTAWWVVCAFSFNALGERIAAGSYWAVTSNLMGARAAAGGIALINSVGSLGGLIGPNLMGALVTRSHGSYTNGLYTAGVLMMVAGFLALTLPGLALQKDMSAEVITA